jgi:hypothetical protein
MPRIVRPGGRQYRLELATQRQTAKLTLSQLINRLLPQRAPQVFRYPEKKLHGKIAQGRPRFRSMLSSATVPPAPAGSMLSH